MLSSADSELMKEVQWFHTIDLGGGVVTPGRKPAEQSAFEFRRVFDPVSLEAASVLDIGAWNGAFSFEAKRRGASRVLAADHFVWVNPYWKGRVGFEIANRALNAGVESIEIDIPDMTPDNVGTWDVVLLLGVLYHVKSPLHILETVASLTKDCMIIETHTDLNGIGKPAMAYYPGATLGGDGSNFFGPNLEFVCETLRELGFQTFDAYFGEHQRLIVHAWRSAERRKLGAAPDQLERHPSVPTAAPVALPPQAAVTPPLLQRILNRLKG